MWNALLSLTALSVCQSEINVVRLQNNVCLKPGHFWIMNLYIGLQNWKRIYWNEYSFLYVFFFKKITLFSPFPILFRILSYPTYRYSVTGIHSNGIWEYGVSCLPVTVIAFFKYIQPLLSISMHPSKIGTVHGLMIILHRKSLTCWSGQMVLILLDSEILC